MKRLINSALTQLKKKKVRQVGSLYSSMIFSIFLGIGVSVVNTRLLGPEQYGDLKFIHTLISFILTFMTFGFFVTGSRLLAINKKESNQTEIIGCLLSIACPIALFFVIILFILSFFVNNIFNNNLSSVIRFISPLLIVFPFSMCIERILVGSNEIYKLSFFRIAPQLFYILMVITLILIIDIELIEALIIQMLVLFFVIFLTITSLKPKFTKIKLYASEIYQRNKSHGFQIYLGSIFSTAGAQIGGLCIAYYMDNVNVGYYSLALMTSTPLTMIPNAVGTAYYKDFSQLKALPSKVTFITILLSTSALVFFLLIIKKAIFFLYSEQFLAAVPLAHFISIGCVLHGLGDYFNRFIGSQGVGKYNRNGAIAVGIVNLLGFFLLIKFFGVMGAAFTKILSSSVYFGVMLIYYKKLKKNIEGFK